MLGSVRKNQERIPEWTLLSMNTRAFSRCASFKGWMKHVVWNNLHDGFPSWRRLQRKTLLCYFFLDDKLFQGTHCITTVTFITFITNGRCSNILKIQMEKQKKIKINLGEPLAEIAIYWCWSFRMLKLSKLRTHIMFVTLSCLVLDHNRILHFSSYNIWLFLVLLNGFLKYSINNGIGYCHTIIYFRMP